MELAIGEEMGGGMGITDDMNKRLNEDRFPILTLQFNELLSKCYNKFIL